MDRRGKKKKEKKGSFFKTFIFFLLFEIVFTIVTILPYGFYGPFTNFRNNVVSLLMGTGSHQYIAKWFFSDKKIAEILKEQNKPLNSEAAKSNVKKIDVKPDTETGIKEIQFSGNAHYSGAYALIITDPKRVKVGVAKQVGYVGQTTYDMAREYNALAAINGGFFEDTNGNGTGAKPNYAVISGGKAVYEREQDAMMYDVVSIDKDGNFKVGGKGTTSDLISQGVVEAVAAEPYIIRNGKGDIQPSLLAGLQPRTVIGQRADKSIIFLVIDGRQGSKLGASLTEVRDLMLSLGAVNAVCLDGGGSTTMYYNGEVINSPSSAAGERAIPDIFYVSQ